jgi:hypothetical protein
MASVIGSGAENSAAESIAQARTERDVKVMASGK